MADGQVVFEITGDSKEINKTLKQVTSDIQSESKKWDQAASQSTDNISNSFTGMLGKVSAALIAAKVGSALLEWGSAAIEAASDLQEVQNVVDTVFGDGASQIEAWAKKAGSQFGLTETQAKKFTSTLGAMAKSSGVTGNQLINMSTDLAGLAADMASFYNLDFETAFEKIRAGISGETMPLKQLGINMSAANLEAFALAQGLEKTYAQMDQGEQTMLRYQYLMQATADAQGDFSKTADGFANSQRRIQTAMDTISTVAGTFLMNTIQPLVSGVADFLTKITSTPERTVLDDLNDIKVDTSEKLAELEKTYDKASDLIKILKDIEEETVTLGNGTTISLPELFTDIARIEQSGGDIKSYLEGLGVDVDSVVLKYNEWKETTRQLTSLVPGLSSVINSETYAIDGGTAALEKNLEEWKKVQEKKIYWAEYYAMEEAVARRKGEQAALEIEAKAMRLAAERARKSIEEQAVTLGINIEADWDAGQISRFTRFEIQPNARTEAQQRYNDTIDEYIQLEKKAGEATKTASKSSDALIEAEELLADEKQAVIELVGEEEDALEDAGDAMSEYKGKSREVWKENVKGAQAAADAIKAVNDYYKGMRDSVEQSVNSTVKGFDKVTSSYDDLIQKQGDLSKETADAEIKYMSEVNSLRAKFGEDWMQSLKELGEESKEWNELSDSEREAYNELVRLRNAQKEVNDAMNEYSPETLQKNLQSQIEFMKTYVENLNQLKEWGVSEEMIASLSDGSKESAAYLQALVAGGKDEAEKVGALYDEVAEKKKTFTDALTENKIAVDQTYSDLVETAREAMEQLNLGDEAANAMGQTVVGIAEGIRDNVPEVASAVDALIAELNRLSGYGFSYGFMDGEFDIPFWLDGSNEKGLDYVPFDGYLSELHEGEGILTAEENRIWQRFKNGQSGHANVDYEALGGVMRDNVKTGGNVYLDGRTVGHVISDAQGRSYRALERSGWQG